MADDTYKTCSVRDGRFVEPCSSLWSTFEGSAFGKGRALFLYIMVNLKTLTPTRSFVVLRMGDHKQKGIAINVCPFCGERIDAPFAEPERARCIQPP